MNLTFLSYQEVNLLNEVGKVFANFFGFLFAIIALINTEVGKSLLMIHHKVMLALVFAIVLYFMTLVLGTMLQLHFRNLLPVIVMLLLGSVVTVLSLMMISFITAWIALALWLFIFALIGYYNHQELYERVLAKIKSLIAGDTVNPQSPELLEIELQEIESDGTQSPRSPPV